MSAPEELVCAALLTMAVAQENLPGQMSNEWLLIDSEKFRLRPKAGV